jgi:hypothetical protein
MAAVMGVLAGAYLGDVSRYNGARVPLADDALLRHACPPHKSRVSRGERGSAVKSMAGRAVRQAHQPRRRRSCTAAAAWPRSETH